MTALNKSSELWHTSVNPKARPVVEGEHDKSWNDHGTGGPPLVRSQLVRIPLVRIFKKLPRNSTCTILDPSPPLVRIQLTRFGIKVPHYYEIHWYKEFSNSTVLGTQKKHTNGNLYY